jgi:hypothetical protein
MCYAELRERRGRFSATASGAAAHDLSCQPSPAQCLRTIERARRTPSPKAGSAAPAVFLRSLWGRVRRHVGGGPWRDSGGHASAPGATTDPSRGAAQAGGPRQRDRRRGGVCDPGRCPRACPTTRDNSVHRWMTERRGHGPIAGTSTQDATLRPSAQAAPRHRPRCARALGAPISPTRHREPHPERHHEITIAGGRGCGPSTCGLA